MSPPQDEIARLKRENETLARTLAEREAFIRTLLHDLRNPLTVTLSALSALTSPELDVPAPQARVLLENAMAAAQQLDAMLEEQGDLARLASGRLRLSFEPLDLVELVAEAMAPNRVEAQSRRLTLRLDAPNDLPRATGDPRRVMRAASRLISLALRHTTAGGVLVRLEQTPAGITLVVADTGHEREPEGLAWAYAQAVAVALGGSLGWESPCSLAADQGLASEGSGPGGAARLSLLAEPR